MLATNETNLDLLNQEALTAIGLEMFTPFKDVVALLAKSEKLNPDDPIEPSDVLRGIVLDVKGKSYVCLMLGNHVTMSRDVTCDNVAVEALTAPLKLDVIVGLAREYNAEFKIDPTVWKHVVMVAASVLEQGVASLKSLGYASSNINTCNPKTKAAMKEHGFNGEVIKPMQDDVLGLPASALHKGWYYARFWSQHVDNMAFRTYFHANVVIIEVEHKGKPTDMHTVIPLTYTAEHKLGDILDDVSAALHSGLAGMDVNVAKNATMH